MKIRHFDCIIRGISPFLMNACPIDVGDVDRPAASREKGTPREQAEEHVYRTETGLYFIPGPNIFRAMVDAGSFQKVGRRAVSTARASMVPTWCAILDQDCVLTPQSFEVDSRPVVIPATNGRITRHRCRWDKWEVGFTVEIDEELTTENRVRQLLDDAGRRIGIGDFRPARRGSFGRFVVDRWEVSED